MLKFVNFSPFVLKWRNEYSADPNDLVLLDFLGFIYKLMLAVCWDSLEVALPSLGLIDLQRQEEVRLPRSCLEAGGVLQDWLDAARF